MRPAVVVDDNDVLRRMMQDLLTDAGLEVHAAADGAECLELVRRLHPGVIVLDIRLPDLDGFTIAQRIKADPRTSDIFIVAVTSYAMSGDRDRALRSGCDLYLSKPIDTRSFAEIIVDYSRRATGA